MQAYEEEHDEDFEDITGDSIGEPAAVWPPAVANAVKALVKSRGKCLCTDKPRKRLGLSSVLCALRELIDTPGGAGVSAPAPILSAPGGDEVVGAAGACTAPSYTPSAPSELVRKLGKAAVASGGAAEATLRLQRNASGAFDALMRQLDAVYACLAAAAPTDFRERIDYWRDACGLPHDLHNGLHRLRVWRNASEHHDSQRWRAEGPQTQEEFTRLVAALERGIEIARFAFGEECAAAL